MVDPSEIKAKRAQKVREMIHDLHIDSHIFEQSKRVAELKSILKYQRAQEEYLKELSLRKKIQSKPGYLNSEQILYKVSARDIGIQKQYSQDEALKAIDDHLILFHEKVYKRDSGMSADQGTQIDNLLTNSPKTYLSAERWKKKKKLRPINYFRDGTDKAVVKILDFSVSKNTGNFVDEYSKLKTYDHRSNSDNLLNTKTPNYQSRHVSFENSQHMHKSYTPKMTENKSD